MVVVVVVTDSIVEKSLFPYDTILKERDVDA